MCRWLAYSGSPVLLSDLLFAPENSLVVQSMHSRLGVEAVNGDGFGVGWYGAQEEPGLTSSLMGPPRPGLGWGRSPAVPRGHL